MESYGNVVGSSRKSESASRHPIDQDRVIWSLLPPPNQAVERSGPSVVTQWPFVTSVRDTHTIVFASPSTFAPYPARFCLVRQGSSELLCSTMERTLMQTSGRQGVLHASRPVALSAVRRVHNARDSCSGADLVRTSAQAAPQPSANGSHSLEDMMQELRSRTSGKQWYNASLGFRGGGWRCTSRPFPCQRRQIGTVNLTAQTRFEPEI